jgi:hypothetical protein
VSHLVTRGPTVLSEEEQRKAQLVEELLDSAVNDPTRADQLLDEHPWLLEHHTRMRSTPLHFLAIEGYAEGVRYLLARGANPDPRDASGSSPLLDCVKISEALDRTEIIELLLGAGADPYFWNEIDACAWHEVRGRECSVLDHLFSPLPSPGTPHETCDFYQRTGILSPAR